MSTSNEHNGPPKESLEDPKLQAAYAEARRALTAEQLRRFEVEESMFPFEEVLDELEAIHSKRHGD